METRSIKGRIKDESLLLSRNSDADDAGSGFMENKSDLSHSPLLIWQTLLWVRGP